jgi:hypothetical protein
VAVSCGPKRVLGGLFLHEENLGWRFGSEMLERLLIRGA